MTGCPPEDELVRMVEGALGEASLAAIESHVDGCPQCATVIANLGALDAAARPRTVGRYQLDRRIGGGGMGEVWAAWDPQLRRDLAVKLVKPERADDGRERERLKREARALARLGHPNVLAVYDVGETEDEVFIATELVIGDTLASRGGANADWRALVKLYTQAARGLAAAHAAGLVHRDIKPANLLIGTDGRVRVADFGLAVRSATPSPLAPTELPGGDAQVTQTGYIAGTPAYMAPEQRLGEPADARADQYALCVALVEGIAGRRPPLDIGRDAMIEFVAERRPREPDLERVCGVVARGLSIDRDDRFSDMSALADALEACVAPTAASTEDVAPIARVAAPRRRAPAIAIAAGAALAGVAAVLAGARLLGASGSTTAATTPVAATATDRTDPTTDRDRSRLDPARGDARDDHALATDRTTDAAEGTEESLAGRGAPDHAARPNDRDGDLRPAERVGVALPGPGSAASIRPKPLPGVPSTPPTTTVAPDVQSQIDLGLAAARRAMLKRDGMACLAAINALPARVPPMTAFTIDLHRGQCEMLRGDCERGKQRVDAALLGMGSEPNGEAMTLAYCPITGPYEVRRDRFVLQANTVRGAASCRSYVTPGRTLAGEAPERDRPVIGGALRSLARCIGAGGACGEAEAVWKLGQDLDGIPMAWDVKGCAAPAFASPATASPNPMASVQALTDTLTKVQQAIVRRDVKVCRAFVANPPADVPQGMTASVDLIAGYCEMMTGDCAGGSQRVARAQGASTSALSTRAAADTYCPIQGTLDQRLARMRAQLAAFADKRVSPPTQAWCSYLIDPAKAAAHEARTTDDRERAANILQHLAWCISYAGRCGEANDLWSLAVAIDPNAAVTPTLSRKCP